MSFQLSVHSREESTRCTFCRSLIYLAPDACCDGFSTQFGRADDLHFLSSLGQLMPTHLLAYP